jgi:hypothetical protein
MMFRALLAALCLSKATTLALEVGDTLCVEGFVMDFFCIERETLLGKSYFELTCTVLFSVRYCINYGYE